MLNFNIISDIDLLSTYNKLAYEFLSALANGDSCGVFETKETLLNVQQEINLRIANGRWSPVKARKKYTMMMV